MPRSLKSLAYLIDNNMKIGLAMIVKGDDKEAVCLDRCLENVAPHVDGLFITSTHKKGEKPNRAVLDIVNKHKGNISYFEWVNDFAKARNFSFAQVPKDYDYILWCDADDVFEGLDKLRVTIEENSKTDTFGFWYLYEFNEHKQPVVVHKKTQVVKNDGCVEWVGALHEDFKENRSLVSKFVEGIKRIHLTDEKRVSVAADRNVLISKQEYENNPEDPRNFWNYGNSLFGAGKFEESAGIFEHFVDTSNSDDERYIAMLRLADCYRVTGKTARAIDKLRYAIGMKVNYPDAYHELGKILFDKGKYEDAERYILRGLMLPPPYHTIIVYNPRDYDFNPMMLLAKVYFQQMRPDMSLACLEKCLMICPNDKQIISYIDEMRSAKDKLENVLEIIKKLQSINDKEELRKQLGLVPNEYKNHPAICSIRNKVFIKTESSGKDLVIYCYPTEFVWNAELFKTKGFGGSEEAVVNLAKEWKKLGWDVTVYNNCGTEEVITDGVVYKPFWMWNMADKQDVTIIWRHPKPLDFDINSRVFIDLHDVVPAGEFTPERLVKVEKIFVKTKFHRSLYPNIPDEKIEIMPNGVDFGLFSQDIKKDQYLLVNTSSPDRSMDVLPKLFKEVKRQVPEAKLKWAYGWDLFERDFANDKQKIDWMNSVKKECEEAGIECLGKIPQSECAKLYLEGNVLAYPTEFAEIDCISVKKAQACSCIPITTDFGALDESVQYGVKVHSDKTKDTWCKPFQFSFGLDDEAKQKEWVDAVVKILKQPIDDRLEMKEWTKKFEWSLIAKQWDKILCHKH